MNKQTEIQIQIDRLQKELDELKSINNQQVTPEQRFLELVGPIKDLQIRIDPVQFPNWFFFFKEEDYLFEWNAKNKDFWANYCLIWRIFEKEFEMEYTDIQQFIKKQVEKHFEIEVSEPHCFVNSRI